MMGGGGLIWFLVYAALVVIPFWRLLPHYGMPKWAALLAVFPLLAIGLLWLIAFKDKLDGGPA